MNERSIDQYEILRELGRGGTSVVYLVTDRADGRNYAMKVLRKDDDKADHLRAEAAVLEVFCADKREPAVLHPGIPAFRECVCDGKGEFAGFVMEYVEGRSLQKILEEGRSFTVREAAEAGLQLCGIIELLHGQKPPMIFRDLKPANILVRPDGQFVLVDYGAYGIGAVLHHMITGRPPLETGLRPLGEILGAEGESWQYSEMAKVLMRCCMTAPLMRYSSCKELEKALQGVLRIRERSWSKGSREKVWNRFLLLANTAAVCLVLALVLAASAAGAKTVEYCALIEKAQKETSIEEKKAVYRRAVALRPEDQEAYICFLRELVTDCVITEEEKSALDDVLFAGVSTGRMWDKASGNEEGNLERMRKKSPGDYADLQMELGKAYFACYEGGREAAKQCFRNALAEGGIWFGDREMAEAMETVLGEKWTREWIDAWRELEAEAVREAETSGNGVFAAAVCKTAAVEIALSADRCREAGTDMEMVKEVVRKAESFVENAESGRIYVPEQLLEELRTAVRSAARAVNGWAK